MRLWVPSGSLQLEAHLEGDQRPAAVLCHPHPQYGGTMDNFVVRELEHALRPHLTTLRFNYRGVGSSGGRTEGGPGERQDVSSAVALLDQRGHGPIAVVGYSFGAWVGMSAGAGDTRVAALAGVSPPVGMFDFKALLECRKPKLLVSGTRDMLVNPKRLQEFHERLPEPKKLELVEDADHMWPLGAPGAVVRDWLLDTFLLR